MRIPGGALGTLSSDPGKLIDLDEEDPLLAFMEVSTLP